VLRGISGSSSGNLHTLWLFGGIGAARRRRRVLARPTVCGLLRAHGARRDGLLYGDVGLGVGVILSATLFFFCVGIALGRVEEFKRIDGED
jgi:hypothetical protein